jgi:hypothetical protein
MDGIFESLAVEAMAAFDRLDAIFADILAPRGSGTGDCIDRDGI